MNIFWIIIAILSLLSFLAIGLFMFAIWRAILGKASIDLRLTTQLQEVGKKLEENNTSLDKNGADSREVGNLMKEVTRNIKTLIDEQKNNR